MDRSYWRKQLPGEPLFDDLLWSRPENRMLAGKLLIMGGNAQGFSAAANAYTYALEAGIGSARVLLPDILQKTVGRVFEVGEYAPSTPSGSFASQALAEIISLAEWGEGVLVAGDMGRNSETAILLEHFNEKYDGRLMYTRDAADYLLSTPGPLLMRDQTLLVLSFAQLQKLAVGARFTRAFTADMDFLRLVDGLHEFTTRYRIGLIIRFHDTIVVAIGGDVTTTTQPNLEKVWRLKTAAHAATWWIQNPTQPLAAFTTAVYEKVT